MKKTLVFPLVLATLLILAAECHKAPTIEPQPNLNQPTREIIIPWCWGSGDGLAPWIDTIKYYVQQPDVEHVVILMVPGAESTWEPRFYNIARDSLQTRFDIDTNKVIGDGWVKVGRDGAHIHPDTLTKKYGMWEPDSLWYASHNFKIGRFTRNPLIE